MNFRIKMIFQYVSAWHASRQYLPRRHRRWLWLFAAFGASSPLNFSCTIDGHPDKMLKHCYVNVDYKNITNYI